eukprot:Clim_evm26s251 gene=Clim_evmTU26s251
MLARSGWGRSSEGLDAFRAGLLAYVTVALCFVFPPEAFVRAGLTVEGILGSYLGSISRNYVEYHLRRSAATIGMHATLAFGFFALLLSDTGQYKYKEAAFMHFTFVTLPYLGMIGSLVFVTASVLFFRHLSLHPSAWRMAGLAALERDQSRTGPLPWYSSEGWYHIAAQVNNDMSDFDRVAAIVDRGWTGHDLQGSGQSSAQASQKLSITMRWILVNTAYSLHVIPRHAADLSIVDERTIKPLISTNLPPRHNVRHGVNVSAVGRGGTVQYVDILIDSLNPRWSGAVKVTLRSDRLRAIHDALDNEIRNTRQIIILQTLREEFAEEFNRRIKFNSSRESDTLLPEIFGTRVTDQLQIDDECVGCMQEAPEVCIRKRCRRPLCGRCLCRPMWCLDCMAAWFSSQTNRGDSMPPPEEWDSLTLPCPTCRTQFCFKDLKYIGTD